MSSPSTWLPLLQSRLRPLSNLARACADATIALKPTLQQFSQRPSLALSSGLSQSWPWTNRHVMRIYNSNSERQYWDAIAPRYNDEILSPLADGVVNPLFDFIKQLDHQKYERAADFACGTGTLLIFLSKHFRETWGIDFSQHMLKIAKQNCSHCSNVHFKQLDMTHLAKVYDFFDIAFTINAVSVDPETPRKMLKEIQKCLHQGGLLAGIFPSFETVLHLKALTYKKYISEGMSEALAQRTIHEEFFIKNKLNERDALYADDGINAQKVFYKDEIIDLIKKAGFRILRVEKVLYSWELCNKFGYGYFPDEDNIWDWFIVAEKT